jgi:oxygen-independent coproporphyrinogen-3 oxidase
MPTVAEKIRERMIDTVGKRSYAFSETPLPVGLTYFGVYIHVPFCPSFCRFCSIYKESLSKQAKDAYLDTLDKEIAFRLPERKASWVYIGGGTPNLLSVDEIRGILAAIRRRAEFAEAGMEILPALADEKYVSSLREAGVARINVEVERLGDGSPIPGAALLSSGGESARDVKLPVSSSHLARLLKTAAESGLTANVDLVLGMPEHNQEKFLEDFRAVLEMGPAQLSAYPWIRKAADSPLPSIPPDAQFGLIEMAADLASTAGYERRSLWTFAQGEGSYDTYRDELAAEYLGFGPGAVSSFNGTETVNPDLASYILSISNGRQMAFVAKEGSEETEWKRFALMLYGVKSSPETKLKGGAGRARNGLGRRGYYKGKGLSSKGIMFAHDLTKSMQEAMPHPLADPRYIENFNEYQAYSQNAQDRFKSRSFALFMLP